jgi:hypothetical protein
MPLYFGKNIRQKGDQLTEIAPEKVHALISDPTGSLATSIGQLRQVASIDPSRYTTLKKGLPYFIGATFYPVARRKENFAAIEYFIIDLDHFDALDAPDIEKCRASFLLRTDLVLLFTSPGGNGLKLLFRFKTPCLDAGLYRLFYQRFLRSLIAEYDLASVADPVTHDVSRVCFFSHDTDTYFQPNAETVDLDLYVDATDPHLTELICDAGSLVPKDAEKGKAADIDEEVLLTIKQKLNPQFRPRPRKKANTPERLEAILPEIEIHLLDQGIEVTEMIAISYGKQLHVTMGKYWAEINMFHGRKGFSVVKTAKSGSQADLAEVTLRLIQGYLNAQT